MKKKKTVAKSKITPGKSLFLKLGLAIGSTGLLVALIYHLAYWQKIYPGIRVVGIAIGNQSPEEARKTLEKEIATRLAAEKITLIFDGRQDELDLTKLELTYQIEKAVQTAYDQGRKGKLIDQQKEKVAAWRKGTNLPLDFELNEEYLAEKSASLAAQIFIPAIEPTIEIKEETPRQVAISPGASGKKLDQRIFQQQLQRQLANLDFSPINLPIDQTSPVMTEGEINQLKQTAEKLLGKKITLVYQEMTWELGEKELLSFLSFNAFNNRFDRFKVAEYVTQLASSINRLPANAAFQFEQGRVTEFKPAETGRELEEEKTIALIIERLETEERESQIDLPIKTIEPQITMEDVNDLGLKELLGIGESWFKGSIAGRVHNVSLASSRLNGVLVPPGETFSFNQTIGEISEATGYQKAYIIKEGRTILGDGGGVCQVSTTLFRAVLKSGLPVVERQAHAYRVGYYEQNSGPGMDATVYSPSTDFKFQNDTGHFILIQTRADEAQKKLTIEFYGTNDGRKAEVGQPRLWDQTAPPAALYQEDPTMPVGTTKQIDWAAWGAKVAFDWKVTRNGEILQERTFYTQYRSWQAVYLVGTKTP